MKPTHNTGGRPRGTHAIRRADLVARFNRSVAPFSEEILQRAVAQALQGDGLALSALVELISRVIASDPERRAQAAA